MKQGEKLLQRDANLSQARQMMLERIANQLKKHDHVIAYFYGGSIGTKKTDDYSDIDLRIVVQPAFFQEIVESKRTIAEKFGKLLFMENPQMNLPYMTAHYDSFIKVDIQIYQPQDLMPSIWNKQIEIGFDPYGVMEHIRNESKSFMYDFNAKELDKWRSTFFANYHELYRSLKRQEYYQAMHIMDTLRWLMVSGWMMEEDHVPNNYLDWSKVEGKRSVLKPDQIEKLISWDVTRNHAVIQLASKSMIKEFRELHARLCKKASVSENSEWIEKVLQQVTE